jgi:hypothetical protein
MVTGCSPSMAEAKRSGRVHCARSCPVAIISMPDIADAAAVSMARMTSLDRVSADSGRSLPLRNSPGSRPESLPNVHRVSDRAGLACTSL